MVSEKEVWEAGNDPEGFKAKHGLARYQEVTSALTSIPEGSYDSKTMQKALNGLKKAK